MIELKFVGGTLKEIREQVMQAAGDFLQFGIVNKGGALSGVSTAPPAPRPLPTNIPPTPPEPIAAAPIVAQDAAEEFEPEITFASGPKVPKEEKRKPGRPPAAAKAAQAPEQKPPPPVVSNISKDELIKALNSVFEKHNIDTARACLSKHGVAKIQELKAPQYEGFLATCSEAFNQEAVSA